MEMLNIRLFWLFIVTIQAFYVSAYYGKKRSNSACDPADPVPLRKITPQMIYGLWINIYVKIPKAWPLGRVATDFSFVIGRPFRNGSVPIETVYRSSTTCNCGNILSISEDTGSNNVFRPTNEEAEWRFLDTIGDYLIRKQCLELDENNRCLRSFVSVNSRTLDPIPLADLKDINQSLRKTMCLDLFEDFHLEARSGTECPAVHL